MAEGWFEHSLSHIGKHLRRKDTKNSSPGHSASRAWTGNLSLVKVNFTVKNLHKGQSWISIVKHLPNTHEVLVQVQEVPNFKTKLYNLTQGQNI